MPLEGFPYQYMAGAMPFSPLPQVPPVIRSLLQTTSSQLPATIVSHTALPPAQPAAATAHAPPQSGEPVRKLPPLAVPARVILHAASSSQAMASTSSSLASAESPSHPLIQRVPLLELSRNGLPLAEVARIGRKLLLFLQPPLSLFTLDPKNIYFEGDELSIPVQTRSIYYSELSLTSSDCPSVQYIAPEVILGLPFRIKGMCWSVGSILLKLFLMSPAFTSNTFVGHLCEAFSLFGPFPEEWPQKVFSRLDTPSVSPEIRQKTMEILRGPHSQAFTALEKRIYDQAEKTGESVASTRSFIDLVCKLLKSDPTRRCDLKSALDHPFISSASTRSSAS